LVDSGGLNPYVASIGKESTRNEKGKTGASVRHAQGCTSDQLPYATRECRTEAGKERERADIKKKTKEGRRVHVNAQGSKDLPSVREKVEMWEPTH